VKRKALVILTVAILAFAMIPALGANAGEGDVKVVTPVELGDPAPQGGDSRFDGLDSLDYVTTAVRDRALGETRGTLYVVVEDNDEDSNAHTNITATFTPPSGATGSTELVFSEATAITRDSNSAAFAAGDVSIADRDRNGVRDQLDVTVLKDGVAILSTNVLIVTDGSVTVQNAGLEGAVTLAIKVATATENDLTNAAGEALVTVRSTSDSGISVHANERNLLTIDTGVTGDTGADITVNVDAAISKDSGTFVGIFGIIEAEWKDMLAQWLEDDGDDGDITPQSEDEGLDRGTIVPGQTPPDPGSNVELIEVVGSTSGETFQRLTNTITLDTALNSDQAGASAACVCIVDSNADGVINRHDFRVEYNRARGSGGVLKSVTYSESGASVILTIVIDGTTVTVADDPLTLDINESVTQGDHVRIRYSTEPTIKYLIDTQLQTRGLLADDNGYVNPQDLHNAFDDLSDDDRDNALRGDDARDFEDTLDAQVDNLGLDPANDGASLLINKLVGVSDGDRLEVRYEDPSRGEGTQRATAEVDLTPPTIGNVDPANNSFTTDDDFDAAFTVTDSGSGIFEDAEELDIGPAKYVDARLETRSGGTLFGDEQNLSPEEDDDVTDGFLYEVTIDVGDEADAAEDDDLNLDIRLTITAYDKAGNRATRTVIMTVDTIEPELLAAFTGWGVVNKSGVDRKTVDDSAGAYVLTENARDWIALVFNGAVAGDSIRASDIAIAGADVTDVVWLNGAGGNVLSIGQIGESRKATDTDFDVKTPTGNRADDVITSTEPGGMGLANDALGQVPNHVLFLQLSADLDTDARPSIQIDGKDLSDLAGNENGDDHSLARASDGLAPVFSVTVANKLSNDALDISISTTEELDRRPEANLELGMETISLDVDDETPSTWSVSENRISLGLTRRDGSQDGVWNIAILGTDESGNTSSASVAKWEFDSQANDGNLPVRGGTTTEAAKLSIETEEVIFLSLNFNHEVDEYDDQTDKTDLRGKDSSNALVITAAELETLDADGDVVADSAKEIDAGVIQSADGKRFVVALGEDDEGVAIAPIGSYQLTIEYSDTAGNTGKYPFKFSVIAQTAEEIKVSPGWSLISIPGRPQSVNIDDVLTDSKITDVWSLNNETNLWEFAQLDKEAGTFMGNLTQIVDGRSYFVRSTTFDPISVLLQRFNPQRTPPQYAVAAGWNSVGYTPAGEERSVSVDGYLSSLGTSGWGMIRMWNANETPPRYETYYSSGVATDGFTTDCDIRAAGCDGIAVVEAGRGYLLFATRNGVIGG
jgi:hypothetical protein